MQITIGIGDRVECCWKKNAWQVLPSEIELTSSIHLVVPHCSPQTRVSIVGGQVGGDGTFEHLIIDCWVFFVNTHSSSGDCVFWQILCAISKCLHYNIAFSHATPRSSTISNVFFRVLRYLSIGYIQRVCTSTNFHLLHEVHNQVAHDVKNWWREFLFQHA